MASGAFIAADRAPVLRVYERSSDSGYAARDHKEWKGAGKKQSGMSDTVKTTRFWYRHDAPRERRHMNKDFRMEEKQFFRKFGELLRKYKSRGWKSW